MSVIEEPSVLRGEGAAAVRTPEIAGRRAKPVKGFALLGVAWLGVMLYEWIDWAARGDDHSTLTGPTTVPTWQKIAATCWEIAMIVALIAVIGRFLIRPLVRERRMTTDGMLVITWLVMWATQDSWANYSQQYFTYNSYLWNFGCPQCHAPGWQSPGAAHMAEPVIFMPGMYMMLFVGSVLTCWWMRKVAARYPRMGTLGLIASAYAFILVIDFALETPWLRLGLYTYAGSIRSMTFFPGHWYQFPVYEGLLWGAAWTSFGVLRYFTDDKGLTLAQRGIDRVKGTSWQKTGLQLLALIGVCETLFLVLCNAPTAMLAQHGDAFPADVLDKSYLTNGYCGIGSTYACPDPRLPAVLSSQSAHFTPQGKLVAPHGIPTQLSGLPTDRTGPR